MSLIESAAERSLKNLLEDKSVGNHFRVGHASVVANAYPELKGISYDELIALSTEASDILEHTPPHDPAYEYLLTNRNRCLKMAKAVNDRDNMGRTEHMLPVHLLVTVGSTTVEANIWIPRINYRASERDNHIRLEITNRLNDSSEWSGGIRHGQKIDFIEF